MADVSTITVATGTYNIKDKSARLSNLYPEQYGAVGDGIHDDTAAFQQCFNLMKQNTDLVLRLANKHYILKSTLELGSYMKIYGTFINNEQEKGTIVETIGANTFSLSDNATGILIKGICFKSNNFLFLSSSYTLRYLSEIVSCGFVGFSQVFNQELLSVKLSNLSINNGGTIGTLSGSDCTIENIYASVLETQVYDSMLISRLSNSVFNHLYLTGHVSTTDFGCNNLITLTSGSGNVFQNLYLDYCYQNAINITNAVDQVRNCIFSNVTLRGFGNYGIYMTGTARNNIFNGINLTKSHVPDIAADNANLFYINQTSYYTQISNITSRIANYVINNQSGTSYILDNLNHTNTFYNVYENDDNVVYSSQIGINSKSAINFSHAISNWNIPIKMDASAKIMCMLDGVTDARVVITGWTDSVIYGFIYNATDSSLTIPANTHYHYYIYGIRNDTFNPGS